MIKQQRDTLINFIRFIFFSIGLPVWYFYLSDLWWMLFVIVILAGIVPDILLSGIPVRTNKKNQAKKSIKTKRKENSKYIRNNGKVRDINTLLLIPFDQMNGHEFEKVVAEYYKLKYKSAIQTPPSKDSGVDIIYTDSDGFRVAVQVKHKVKSGKPVDAQEIYKINGAKRNHKCNLAEFVSSTGYTKDALQYTDQMKINTHGAYWVNNDLKKWKEKEAKLRKLS
ncbi:restriction endonuclease [Mesobacillus stamsii]|uniref:Restriction system protein n=1 Tax=Mesobacillus stamsii TaxID=225347 RepID=A0ABU0FSM8_9BACI|nr:restriction endonuclease [Mesobacillus stamsii]MDQ0412911.1 restriction system protein [Mesobacillus stamsii]